MPLVNSSRKNTHQRRTPTQRRISTGVRGRSLWRQFNGKITQMLIALGDDISRVRALVWLLGQGRSQGYFCAALQKCWPGFQPGHFGEKNFARNARTHDATNATDACRSNRRLTARCFPIITVDGKDSKMIDRACENSSTAQPERRKRPAADLYR